MRSSRRWTCSADSSDPERQPSAGSSKRLATRALSVDELVYERHGQHGVDYDEGDYPTHEAEARAELDQQLRQLIREGRNVALDYGFWSREQRDRYKHLIAEAGGQWRLLYFKVELPEIRRRLAVVPKHVGSIRAALEAER
jgi:predicted kinase